MKTWVAAALAGLAFACFLGAGFVGGTPVAKADDNMYLGKLASEYWFYRIYGPDTLLAEGHKACAAVKAGAGDTRAAMSKTIDMVQADLSAPQYTASDIVNAAVDLLDC